jgi:pantoate--beta-alanine ligase
MIARTIPALHRALDRLRLRKATIALVPTMGALHDGHVSLVRLAKRRASRVVVSIFVNPTQFAPTEDFGSYPRTWKSDVARLAAEDVDLIWNPDVKTMYPDGFATRIVPEGPAIAGLEDRFRPHFFGGVATVVGKLFTQVQPDSAIFGEKDFQQLRVVARMAGDLDLRVKVTGSRTVRRRNRRWRRDDHRGGVHAGLFRGAPRRNPGADRFGERRTDADPGRRKTRQNPADRQHSGLEPPRSRLRGAA